MASTTGPHNHAVGTAAVYGEDQSQDMGALLAEESMDYPLLRRGDIVEGLVVGRSRTGIIVDIGAKSEGIVPPPEMQSLGRPDVHQPEPGDKVLVFIVQTENQEGQIILSLDRARGEKGWRLLQELHEAGENLEAEVTGYNKGGLLVEVEGVTAFVPLSQLVSARHERGNDSSEGSLTAMVGRTLRFKVIELNRRRSRAILSERAAMQEWRAQQKERVLAELHEGEIRRGRITSIRDFGIFVDLGGADGLAHLSEISWGRGKSPEEMFSVGDEVDVYVLKVDHENRKIALSLRRAQPEQWESLIDKYEVGQLVVGHVTKLTPFGAFARIDESLEGLIHVSELAERHVTHPREVVKEGDTLPLKIVRIERERHRLGLSLKQARPEAEAEGYVFGEAGGVIRLPGAEAEVVVAAEGAAPAPTDDTEGQEAAADLAVDAENGQE
ncbi:MAG: 30S ribosomal protein S1 [Dehalococcoidia bacterium]